MKSLNKLTLIGNLGDDIKMHHFDGGGCLGRAPLATSFEYTKKGTDEKVQETEWHSLIFRNKGAEIIEKYTKKGSKLFIEGRIRTRKWKDDQGNDRYSTEVIVSDFLFLDSKSDSNGTGSSQSGSQAQNSGSNEEDKDDLPF